MVSHKNKLRNESRGRALSPVILGTLWNLAVRADPCSLRGSQQSKAGSPPLQRQPPQKTVRPRCGGSAQLWGPMLMLGSLAQLHRPKPPRQQGEELQPRYWVSGRSQRSQPLSSWHAAAVQPVSPAGLRTRRGLPASFSRGARAPCPPGSQLLRGVKGTWPNGLRWRQASGSLLPRHRPSRHRPSSGPPPAQGGLP